MDSIENEKLNMEQYNNNSKFTSKEENSNDYSPLKTPVTNTLTTTAATTNITTTTNSVSSVSDNLRKIEELDEVSLLDQAATTAATTAKSPSSVAEAVQMTGSLVNDFAHFSEMLSSRIEEINTQSNKIEQELRQMTATATTASATDKEPASALVKQDAGETTEEEEASHHNHHQVMEANHKTSEKIIKDLVENIMNKKLDQIKQTMISLPKKISHFNNSINNSSNNNNGGGSGQLSFNPTSINKKLAQLKSQINLSSAANGGVAAASGYASGAFASNSLKLALDMRLESSFYQTLEHGLFVQVCRQSEMVTSSLSDPLPSSGVNVAAAWQQLAQNQDQEWVRVDFN